MAIAELEDQDCPVPGAVQMLLHLSNAFCWKPLAICGHPFNDIPDSHIEHVNSPTSVYHRSFGSSNISIKGITLSCSLVFV